MNYQDEMKSNAIKAAKYKAALVALKEKVALACVEENRRAGALEAYNLPAELSKSFFDIYSEHCQLMKDPVRWRWAMGRSVYNTEEYLGYSLGYYGRNADKFYVYRISKEQNQAVLNALASAAVEQENAL